jgi:anti-sigma factor RsiW
MDRFVNHDELIEALGAYALDAMDPEETEAVRLHLVECPRCAEEVAEYHEVAALLGNAGGEAPAHLWEAIAGKIGEARSPDMPRLVPSAGSDRTQQRSRLSAVSRNLGRRPWLLAAAAAVVVIALLSVQTVRLDNRPGSIDALASSALANPSSQKVELKSASSAGVTDAEVVVLPSGSAYLLNKGLPALPSGETYQLWGRTNNQLISLGVLGGRPTTVAFTVGPAAKYAAYVVTAERSGGVVRTSHRPVATSAVESA